MSCTTEENTMKTRKLFAPIMFVLAMAVIVALSGCNSNSNDNDGTNENGYQWATGDGTNVEEFFFSTGLDENGFFAGVAAVDFVGSLNFNPIVIPRDVHNVPQEYVQRIIEDYLERYIEIVQIVDRAVQSGDWINIDFVGTVDGVPFEDGSTGGMGHDLLIGSGQFIPGFEEQLIGAMPGSVVNVELSFPEVYPQAPHLAGVDALFVTTINFIEELSIPVFDDAFVAENLYNEGFTTAAEMRAGIEELLRAYRIARFITDAVESVTIYSVPEALIEFFERALIEDWRREAARVGSTFEIVLQYFDVSSVGEFLIENHADVREQAETYLVLQAIAESINLAVTDSDIAGYFNHFQGTPDHAEVEQLYGRPYMLKMVRSWLVFNHINDNAVFE